MSTCAFAQITGGSASGPIYLPTPTTRSLRDSGRRCARPTGAGNGRAPGRVAATASSRAAAPTSLPTASPMSLPMGRSQMASSSATAATIRRAADLTICSLEPRPTTAPTWLPRGERVPPGDSSLRGPLHGRAGAGDPSPVRHRTCVHPHPCSRVRGLSDEPVARRDRPVLSGCRVGPARQRNRHFVQRAIGQVAAVMVRSGALTEPGELAVNTHTHLPEEGELGGVRRLQFDRDPVRDADVVGQREVGGTAADRDIRS